MPCARAFWEASALFLFTADYFQIVNHRAVALDVLKWDQLSVYVENAATFLLIIDLLVKPYSYLI